jgi:hypothetical protein
VRFVIFARGSDLVRVKRASARSFAGIRQGTGPVAKELWRASAVGWLFDLHDRLFVSWRQTKVKPGFAMRSVCDHQAFALASLSKSECSPRVPEKMGGWKPRSATKSVLCSPVSRAEIAESGHYSRVLRESKAGILWGPDCVAEGEGFEPPVRFPGTSCLSFLKGVLSSFPLSRFDITCEDPKFAVDPHPFRQGIPTRKDVS